MQSDETYPRLLPPPNSWVLTPIPDSTRQLLADAVDSIRLLDNKNPSELWAICHMNYNSTAFDAELQRILHQENSSVAVHKLCLSLRYGITEWLAHRLLADASPSVASGNSNNTRQSGTLTGQVLERDQYCVVTQSGADGIQGCHIIPYSIGL